MRKLISLLCCAGLCISLCSCAGEPASGSDVSATPADAEALEKVTLCLDWTPNTNHTGFYAAQALGYYEENGLDVEIVQPPEDGATALCAAGQCEFAVTAQDSLASAFASPDPLPVTAVAALLQHNTSGIIAVPGEGMSHPAGLEGHNYATWNSPIELAMMEYVITQDGGDFSKVELIPNSITDEAGAIQARQTAFGSTTAGDASTPNCVRFRLTFSISKTTPTSWTTTPRSSSPTMTFCPRTPTWPKNFWKPPAGAMNTPLKIRKKPHRS